MQKEFELELEQIDILAKYLKDVLIETARSVIRGDTDIWLEASGGIDSTLMGSIAKIVKPNIKVKKGEEYAILTNIIHQEWTDITVGEHKNLKNLKKRKKTLNRRKP